MEKNQDSLQPGWNTIKSFLDVIFSFSTLGQIVIKKYADGSPLHCGSVEEAAENAIKLNVKGEPIYFGLGKNTGSGHKAKDVETLTCLWAEVDIDKTKDREEERAKLLKHIEEFEPKCSIISDSRSGFHCYWLLKKPISPDEAIKLNKLLTRAIGGCRGMTKGPSAILRLPGTIIRERDKSGRLLCKRLDFFRFEKDLRYDPEHLYKELEGFVFLEDDISVPKPVAPQYDEPPLEYDSGGVDYSGNITHSKEQKLLQGALKNLRKAVLYQKDGKSKVVCSCPFEKYHDGGIDETPSAVIFENGWLVCSSSSCPIKKEHPSVWTQRPEVIWAAPLYKERKDPIKGDISIPRIVIKNIAPVIMKNGTLERLKERGDEWQYLSEDGEIITFKDLKEVRGLIEGHYNKCKDLILRVLVAILYLFQKNPTFWCDVIKPDDIADILRYERRKDGYHRGENIKRIKEALDVLQRIYISIPFSRNNIKPPSTPMIERTNEEQIKYRLNRSIISQINHGPANIKIRKDIFGLKSDELLSLYINIIWTRVHDAKSDKHILQKLLERSNLWNDTRFINHKKEYMIYLRGMFDKLKDIKLISDYKIIEDKILFNI